VANLHLGPKHVAQLGAYIREQRESAQYSLRQLALAAGVSNPYLSQIERGLRKPSAEILQQLAKALQISAETLYLRAGLLDEPAGAEGGTDDVGGAAARAAVISAIIADPMLDPRQKQLLRDIYQSFRDGRSGDEGRMAPDLDSDARPDPIADPALDLDLGLNADADPTSAFTVTPTSTPTTTPEVKTT
jgi:transcriptional regulator with XRE-family HTH domain